MSKKTTTRKKATTKLDPKSYWKNYLANFTSASKIWLEGLEIPEKASTSFASYLFAKIPLTKKQADNLLKFSKQQDVTLNTLIYGTFSLLLHRYANTDDVIFGLGEASSHKKHTALTLTYDAKYILPIRSQIQENESIKSYLKKLGKEIKGTIQQQKTFADLYEQDDHFKNLYRYLFLFDNNKSIVNSISLDPGKYPLILLRPSIKSLRLGFVFNSEKFTQKSIQNLIQHFILIIERLLQDHQSDVTHFPMLTPIEKRQVLNQWSKPKYPFVPELDINMAVPDLFSAMVKKFPNATAITYQDQIVTYQQLDDHANRLAEYLTRTHIQKGNTIAVLMERTPALLVAMLGIFKLGAIYVPINPKYPDDRIEFVIEDAGAAAILANNHDRIPKKFLNKTILLDDEYETLKAIDTITLPSTASSNQIAYVIYTSGTTGQPKGVMIRHVSLINLVNWYQSFFSVSEQDASAQFASQAFDSFFCETIPFLCSGASVHIIDDHAKLTPTALMNFYVQQKITVCDLPTAYAQVLLNMPWPQGIQLRLMKIGGECLTSYPPHEYSFDIWNGYGPTESTVEATFYQIYHKNNPHTFKKVRHLSPPIGKPIANAEMYVVDQHLEPVPMGSVGELLIGGIIIATGYLNRKELTREKFIRNYFSRDPYAKLYRTGDLVRWLGNGNLEYVGRADHQIKIRGYRIELSEIETNIRQHADIKEVIVLAKEMITGQKSLVAYLVPNLNKIRIPFHERCLIALNDVQFIDAFVEDISKEGIAIGGFTGKMARDQHIRVSFALPGLSETQWLTGRVIWQQDQRLGIEFDKTLRQKAILEKSINHYLATHNLMETLRSVATKRSIRQALKNKLPEYMIPSIFSILPNFPLTFNGKIDWKALPPPQDFERLLERPYVKPRTETETILAEIWSEILNLKQISVTDNFFDLGGNSLFVSQLSVKILQRFGQSIPAKLLFDLPFIPILAEYIDTNGEKYTTISNIQNEITHDAILHDDIMPTKKFGGDITKPRSVLLTGAAGFLGVYLLRELLKQTDAKIYCLIRKTGFESSAKKLIVNVEHYMLSEEISLNNRRIIIIPGDISLHQFGIATEQYENLAEKIDVIYHCGAQVNTMAAYTNLRASNVQGTIEIIKFATHKIDKAIHYISTLSAAYKLDAHGNYIEEFPDADLGALVGGYAISKWVSERLLTQIKNRGLPISIYRSGYILGQSDTGITNFNDALLLLIKGCIQLGFAPDWNEKIMILPVDFVSKATVAISLNNPKYSQVYHLDHPKGILWRDLIDWLNNYGYNIKLCSHGEWQKKLTSINADNALYPFLPHYLEQKEQVTPGTSIIHTKSALKEMGMHFPDISDHLLQLYLNYLCRSGFYPTPNKKGVAFTI